jgi:hypothetical protein
MPEIERVPLDYMEFGLNQYFFWPTYGYNLYHIPELIALDATLGRTHRSAAINCPRRVFGPAMNATVMHPFVVSILMGLHLTVPGMKSIDTLGPDIVSYDMSNCCGQAMQVPLNIAALFFVSIALTKPFFAILGTN